MVALIDSTKVFQYQLYNYRPLFLNGTRDGKSAYRLIEEIFSESIKQSTISPEIEKSHLASVLGVTERTVERATKKLIDEGRISYQHSSKGRGKYLILFQENISLPNECLFLDSESTNPISLAISAIANRNNPLSIAEPLAGSIVSTKPTRAQEVAPVATSNNLVCNQYDKETNSTFLFYNEQDIEDMIYGLTEDEEDSLVDEIAQLADKWESTSDVELQKALKLEYQKSKSNHYGDWLWEKAQREVYRSYVINLLEGQGYIYKNQGSLQSQTFISNSTMTNFLLGDSATPNLVGSAILSIPNTNTIGTNVATFFQENNSLKKELTSTLNSDKDVAVFEKDLESPNKNALPLEIAIMRQKCRRFPSFSSPSTDANFRHPRTRVHARVRMREVKLIKLDNYNNYLNFLTSLKNGSLSCNSTTTSTTTISGNYKNTNTMANISIATDNPSEIATVANNQTQDIITTSEFKNLTDTLVDETGNQVGNTSKNTSITNTANITNIFSNADVLTNSKHKTKNANKAKSKGQPPTPEMIKRLESDRVSSKDFSLWKIVNKDCKIQQDSEGNYLLPNRLQNHPKSKYSFWDILGYAQTQKSVKAPVGFSITKYYSGEIDNSSTFQDYLKERANSLIGAARKPTQPTPEQKLEAQKAKQEYEELLAFENSREQLWKNLPTDKQQNLLLEEIKTLKANKDFAPQYQKLAKNLPLLENVAINSIKTKLAKQQLYKNNFINT
jgi:hypothetical protein